MSLEERSPSQSFLCGSLLHCQRTTHSWLRDIPAQRDARADQTRPSARLATPRRLRAFGISALVAPVSTPRDACSKKRLFRRPDSARVLLAHSRDAIAESEGDMRIRLQQRPSLLSCHCPVSQTRRQLAGGAFEFNKAVSQFSGPFAYEKTNRTKGRDSE